MCYLATEEFDHLCFEFGIELDEDVRQAIQCIMKQVKKALLDYFGGGRKH